MDSIIEDVNDRIDSEIDRTFEEISSSTEITDNELRELRGTLNAKKNLGKAKIEALDIEKNHWETKSKEEKEKGKNDKALLYDAIRRAAELRADYMRLELNEKPVSEEVVNMIEEVTDNNDPARLQRFKEWARENVVGVSAIVISAASVITAAVMGARNTIKKGGKALGKFAKATSKVFKKLGPLLSALGTLLSKMILAASQRLLWLSQNLWILFLTMAYIYNEYRKGQKRRRR